MPAIETDSKTESEPTVPATSTTTSSSSIVEEIQNACSLIEKSAINFDPRYVLRVFRELGPLRRKLTKDALGEAIFEKYPAGHGNKAYLLDVLKFESSSQDVREDSATNGAASADQILPELDMFIHLLIQIYLHDKKDFKRLNKFNAKVILLLKSYNRRSLDFIVSKNWFYIARTNEVLGNLVAIRPDLLLLLRTLTLRHDTETCASTITLLLRNYLLSNDVNQLSNLVEKTQFPSGSASNSLVARYCYYLLRINAIELNYSNAHEYSISAIRKTPQTRYAVGFLESATKLNILIELLMGDIPELKIFRQFSSLENNLIPYLALTRLVRVGDLNLFNETLSRYEQVFKKDTNYNLVLRLRQNVIKTGIRIISLSYVKISLKDICIKLHLDSELSAEYIVAKLIRDGVIDAEINHEYGYMSSREILDVYSTKNPQEEFDQRIKFTMQLHNDSVKLLRFPMSNNRLDLKNDLEQKEREQDYIELIQDGDFDFI